MATITQDREVTVTPTKQQFDQLAHAVQGYMPTKSERRPEVVAQIEEAIRQRFDEAKAAYTEHTQSIQDLEAFLAKGSMSQIENFANNPDQVVDTKELEQLADRDPDTALAELEKLLLDSNHKATEQQVEHTNEPVQHNLGMTLAAYYAEARMLDPSLVGLYASMTAEERVNAQVLAMQDFSKEQFTPEEVREMLRRFILLDRLIDPGNVLAKARQQAINESYNAPQDAERLKEMRDGIRRAAQMSVADQENYNRWMRKSGRVPDPEAVATQNVDFTKLEKYLAKQFEKALTQRNARSARTDQGINYRDEYGMVPQPGEQNNPFNELTDPHQIANMLERHGAKRKNLMGRIARLTTRMRMHFRNGLRRADELDRPNNPYVKAIGERSTSIKYAQEATRSMERVL